MTKLGRGLLAVTLTSAMALTACGGSSSPKNASAAKTTTTTAASTTTTAAGTTTSDGSGGGSVDASQLSAKCQEAYAAMGKALAGASGGSDIYGDVSQLKAIAAAAPADIKPDFTIFVDGLDSITQALKNAGYDPTKTPTAADELKFAQAMAAIGPKLKSADYEAASAHVTAWFTGGCKG
jgi:hypothetical protein